MLNFEFTESILHYLDYGDGNFIATSSSANHTYSTPGNYTTRAKVIDSEGEYSVSILDLTIAELTIDEKIAKAYQEGQQYVQDNLEAFGLTTIKGKDQAVADAEAAKDIVIKMKDQTIATMFTQEQKNKAIHNAVIKFDINDDGKIGMEEAINALQIITNK